jgi:MoaA/NifB/PqqE/SkfB family radical SAM enzyme
MNEITFRASPMGPHITLPRLDRNGITGPALDRLEHTGYLMSVNDDPVAATGERCPFINAGATAIAWDGYLSPCLPLVHNHLSYLNQTHRTLRRHVIGNVKDHNLLDLWNDPEYTAFRQRVQLFDFPPCTACGGCQMLEENQEDCYGNAFPTCGGCLWAQGIIQCP